MEAQKAEKFNNIRDMLMAEAKRGVGKGALQDALLAAGMDAQRTSSMLTFPFPKGEDAKAEQAKAIEHNKTAKKGEKIDLNEQLKINRGKATVAEVLEKKKAKATARGARPEGNASTTTTTTTSGVKETVTLEQWSFRLASLVTLGTANKLTNEQMSEAMDEILATNESGKAKSKK